MNRETLLRPVRTDRQSPREVRIPGAVLALASASTAALSVILLFGYTTGLSSSTEALERTAQAFFAHAGTADLAEELLAAGDPSLELRPMGTAGLVSSCTVRADSSRPREACRITLPGAEDLRVVRCRGGVLVAGRTADGLAVTYHGTGSDRPRPGFPVTLPGTAPTGGWTLAGGPSTGGILGVAAAEGEGSPRLYVLGEDASVAEIPLSCNGLEDPRISASALLSTGSFGGRPMAVLCPDGTNEALLVPLDGSGTPTRLGSPAGTCPVFLPGGGLFGDSAGGQPGSEPAPHVADFFSGDFNQDGETDAAWAGPSSLACLLSGRDQVLLDTREDARLAAWGFLEGRFGLGGLWEDPDGRLTWRKLLWSGFQQLPAGGIALAGYAGRIHSEGGITSGVRSGRLEFTGPGSTGEPELVLEGAIPFDLDGSGPTDAVLISGDAVTLLPDPLGPAGAVLRLTVTTVSSSGEPLLTGVRILSGGNRRPEAGA